MSTSKLPARASLEYLKKLAKDRLRLLRQADPRAQLAAALLAVARDHGCKSWRDLKAEVERTRAERSSLFFTACAAGDLEALRRFLADDPGLVHAKGDSSRHTVGGPGLHAAAELGKVEAVRLLLAHGADPNARDAGDNASALHFAAGYGHLDTARALLDAGADVHGFGDLHEMEVIGWATALTPRGEIRADVAALLFERGARHHVFSAIALGDASALRELVEESPEALDRRMSRFEQRRTVLHFALDRQRSDLLELLIELGADLEAEDGNGQTALAVAMLRGDREAMRLLHAAGARQPEPPATQGEKAELAEIAAATRAVVPMISVPDVAAALAWYVSIGFRELSRHADGGRVDWGLVSFGKAEVMMVPQLHLGTAGQEGRHDASLWFYTDRIEPLYQLWKARQLAAARAALAGETEEAIDAPTPGAVALVEDLCEPFYGGRQFSIRDPNGYVLYFLQPED